MALAPGCNLRVPSGAFAYRFYATTYNNDAIVDKLLRSPTFHRGVRRIHRNIEDYKYGRDPHDPLRPGEATRDPNAGTSGFMNHFIDELRSQLRGTPTNPPPPPPKSQPPKK
ncbi:hypothetical protein DL771_008144 [Monosporascus sp. 5C6A]|nr:hypothetical protein DL771_008144 [Monosporascus sp. 5C6A]